MTKEVSSVQCSAAELALLRSLARWYFFVGFLWGAGLAMLGTGALFYFGGAR